MMNRYIKIGIIIVFLLFTVGCTTKQHYEKGEKIKIKNKLCNYTITINDYEKDIKQQDETGNEITVSRISVTITDHEDTKGYNNIITKYRLLDLKRNEIGTCTWVGTSEYENAIGNSTKKKDNFTGYMYCDNPSSEVATIEFSVMTDTDPKAAKEGKLVSKKTDRYYVHLK